MTANLRCTDKLHNLFGKKPKEESMLESEIFQMIEGARDKSPNTGFMARAVHGEVHMEQIFPFPVYDKLDSESENDWMNEFKQFLYDRVDPCVIEREGNIPKEVRDGFKKLGATILGVPKAYGGKGFSYYNQHRLFTALGSWCLNSTVWISPLTKIGIIAPILRALKDAREVLAKAQGNGIEEEIRNAQREVERMEKQATWYFTRLVEGAISCFAMTEAKSGTNQAMMETIVRRVFDENGVQIGYRIKGEKLWSTGSAENDDVPMADFIVVVGKIHTIEKYAEEGRDSFNNILLIVHKDDPGYSVRKCYFAGMEAIPNGVLTFNDVFVPLDRRIGNEQDGFPLAMNSLAGGRHGLGPISLGGMKQALQISRWYARTRIQLGRRTAIIKFERIAEYVARIAAETMALEALSLYDAWLADSGKDTRIEAVITKVRATQLLRDALHDATAVLGGRGFETRESERRRGEPGVSLEMMWRGARVTEIFEGTNEALPLLAVRELLDDIITGFIAIFAKGASLGEKSKAIQGFARFLTSHKKSSLESEYEYPMDYKKFILAEALNIRNKLQVAALAHNTSMPHKQIVSNKLLERVTDIFLMALTLSYAEANKEKTLAMELALHFCDLTVERLTGTKERMDDRWIKDGSHNRVVPLAEAIAKQPLDWWVEDGIVSQLQKEVELGKEAGIPGAEHWLEDGIFPPKQLPGHFKKFKKG